MLRLFPYTYILHLLHNAYIHTYSTSISSSCMHVNLNMKSGKVLPFLQKVCIYGSSLLPLFLSATYHNTREERGRIFYPSVCRGAERLCGISRHSAIALSPISADRLGPDVAIDTKQRFFTYIHYHNLAVASYSTMWRDLVKRHNKGHKWPRFLNFQCVPPPAM